MAIAEASNVGISFYKTNFCALAGYVDAYFFNKLSLWATSLLLMTLLAWWAKVGHSQKKN